MATAMQRAAIVGPDGTIAVQVPELMPGQRVRVTIETESAPVEAGRAIDLLATLSGHRLLRSPEEVDAYLRAERDAWDR